MNIDYVTIAIDSRMKNATEVTKQLRKDRGGGIPWLIIVDASGQELITGDGPKGNIGCPIQPEEVAWFQEMITKTKQRMTDEQFAGLGTALEKFALKYRR